MAVTTTNLGVITAYGDAVAAGYTGTKAEWQALMASYATVGQQAVDAKNVAVAAKNTAVSKATEATTAASTATTKANEASASAQSIAQSAAQIQENTDDIDQLKSELTAIGTVSNNLYNPATDEVGSIDSSGGIHPENTDYKHSDFIFVGTGNKVCAKTATSYNGTDGVTIVAYYDASKNYLTREQVNGTTYVHPMTGTQTYIRIVCNVNTPPFMVNIGDSLLPYEPYGFAYADALDNHIQNIISEADKLSKDFRWSARAIPAITEFSDYTGIATANPTLSELYALYDGLVANYPGYVSKKDLGTDQSGTYHIYQYSFAPETVSTGTVPFSIPAKPKVLLGSGTHGNGEAGDKREMVVGLYYFFANLCSNWKTNDGLSYLRWNVHFEVIPVQNPWGYVNNNRRNSRGVDINRNFPYGWRSGTQGAVDYGGSSALSEAESVIIKNFIEDNGDAIFYYDIHATAGVQDQDKMMYWSMLPNTNMSVIANDCIIQLTKKWDDENIGGLLDNVLHGYIDGEQASGFGSISQWVSKVANIPAATFEGFPNFKNSTEVLEGDTIMRMCLDEIACANLNALRFFKYYM